MQQPGLTTAAVKRSPLTVVVALPRVLRPGGGAVLGDASMHVSGQLYNDGGEDEEVRGQQ